MGFYDSDGYYYPEGSDYSDDYEEEEEAPEHPEASCATAEASELSSAEVDGSFERGVRPGVEGAESVTEA